MDNFFLVVELSRGASITTSFRGCEQWRFTSKVNVLGREDLKNQFGGQASNHMSLGSAYQKQS